MMSVSTNFRLACQAAHAIGNLPPVRLPDVSATAKALLKLQALPTTAREPAAVDLNQVALQIAEQLAAGTVLTRKQLREAPWCLWSTKPALAEDQGLLEGLLRLISGATSARPFRTLATAFLAAYGEQQVGRVAAAAVLSLLATKWKGVWGFLQDRYSIFDLIAGPKRLALEVNASGRSPAEILSDAGLGAMNAKSGLTEAVILALLTELGNGVERDHLARLEKVRRFALRADGLPIFGGQKNQILEALLRPIALRPPGEETQDEFLRLIVLAFGDPRLRPGQWVGLPHKDIVIGWLTRQSLRQFLDVVDATTNDKLMWKYRRAFWEGTYEYFRRSGVTIEAWVAFGPDGLKHARHTFKDTKFAAIHSTGKQVESGHAVLLFRIGRCLIADWSHNGKCNVWSDANAKSAPRMFEMRYGSDEVRIAGAAGNMKTRELFSIMHMASETYNWQDQVAQRLFEVTSHRVPRSAYKL
ncbi:EH signature domain-containing protein [Mesorhizobium sp. M0408]|uniref:EH signature domain-containing protein n=1 Tax=Mesorhizobium sp. M0408 TaxID=2956942 RepID=UPI003334F777